MGSLWFAEGVIGLILGRWVHSGAPLVSLGSSRVALEYALGVVGFIMDHWAPYGLLRLFEVGGFTRMRPGGCWVKPWSLGNALLGVDFMRGRWVHPGRHSGTPLGSLGSSGDVGFTRVRPWVVSV